MGLEYFLQKFFNKLMQRERDFGRPKYFSKISYLPSPLKVNWIPLLTQFLLCTIVDQQTDVTRPKHTPTRTKRHNALRMKMRLNQDVRGDAKKCASGYAMATPFAYTRVYLEPILIFSHYECDGKMNIER